MPLISLLPHLLLEKRIKNPLNRGDFFLSLGDSILSASVVR
jgi:hypothetical protein